MVVSSDWRDRVDVYRRPWSRSPAGATERQTNPMPLPMVMLKLIYDCRSANSYTPTENQHCWSGISLCQLVNRKTHGDKADLLELPMELLVQHERCNKNEYRRTKASTVQRT